MVSTVDQVAGAADELLAMVNEMVGTALMSPPRVRAARHVIEAVVAVDFRLQRIVEELREKLQSDGVLVVILDDQTASVVIMAGGETIEREILDANDVTLAEDSYCKYCVVTRGFSVFPDAKKVAALRGNPYIDIVRGYVGAALIVQDHVVGSLCATADQPRDWTDEEVALLRAQAQEVSVILEEALEKYHLPTSEIKKSREGGVQNP